MYICMHYFSNYDIYVITIKGSDKPTIKEIINDHIRDEVAVKWYDLGIQLLSNEAKVQLEIIKSNYPSDAQKCSTAMFEYWLKVDTGASWIKLIEAIKTVNFSLAERISKKFFQGNNYTYIHTIPDCYITIYNYSMYLHAYIW